MFDWGRYILIEDTKKQTFFVFDSAMNFVRTLGKRGRGPGEFTSCGNVLTTTDSLYVWDRTARRITVYDTAFTPIRSFNSPPEIIPTLSLLSSNSRIIKINGQLFLSWLNLEGKKQTVRDNGYRQRNKSICVLDSNFQFRASIYPWDEAYFAEEHQRYMGSVGMVSIAESGNSFFAQQHGTWHIAHIDGKGTIQKIFGCQPKFYRSPPNDKNAPPPTEANPEKHYAFMSNLTVFYDIAFDKKTDILYSYYSTQKLASWKTGNVLANDEHYLQAYNKSYECILDVQIPGILKLLRDGKIYVLTKDNVDGFTLIIYQLQKK